MPIVQSHHESDPWRPRKGWPDDARVQWGGAGLVLRAAERGGSYGTAFFEAFPAGGGFIRGEGATLEDAEDEAFGAWLREDGCPGHRFGRGRHANGGGTCRVCGAFRGRAFKPVHRLGAWRDPLNAIELQTIGMGGCVPWDPSDPESRHHARELWLRARLAGIDLPPVPEGRDAGFSDACHRAVQDWVGPRMGGGEEPGVGPADTLEGFMGGMALRGLAGGG